MPNLFIISDTHFGHANILKFTREDGSRLRVFKDVDQMDEIMVERWNRVVRPQDKVYHLGDVAFNKRWSILARCNGHKRLVLGNHDPSDLRLLSPYFEAFYSSRLIDRLVLTHIPIHRDSINGVANVHGHVHNNLSALRLGPKYFNACVEVIDYTPISLEDLQRRVRKQQEAAWGVTSEKNEEVTAL